MRDPRSAKSDGHVIDRRTVMSAICAGVALPAVAHAGPRRSLSRDATMLYANVGATLTRYEIDTRAFTLTPRDSVTLPEALQYAWPHRSGRFLYAVTSDTAPGNGATPGTSHHLQALRVEPGTGRLSIHGAPTSLPSRPIHVSTDIPSDHALVAFNKPSALRIYRINPDGSAGDEVPQTESIDPGIYAHQARVSPDNRLALLVTRGNEGTAAHAEEPGALKVFAYRDGILSQERSIAPDGGHRFGPRHLDFHPTRPWIYLSIETQNQLAMLRMDGDRVGTTLLHRVTTLPSSGGGPARQAAGAVHVHPNGRFVYVANRAEQTEIVDGTPVFKGGVNGIVAYAIDQQSGEPRAIQHIDSRAIHPRTFHIDPSGRMLVAEHNLPVMVRDSGSIRQVSAGLSVFRIADDGTLSFVRKYDIDVGRSSMFWIGMSIPPGSGT